MRALRLAFVIAISAAAPSFAAEPDYEHATVEQLIDALTLIGPDQQGSADFEGFLADDTPLRTTVGTLSSPDPTLAPQLRELVRRGPDALPALIRHLSDRRATKLSVGSNLGKPEEIGLWSQWFSDEYDAKAAPYRSGQCFERRCFEKHFSTPYTLRVGD